MLVISNAHGVEVFATCPQISPENKATYTEDIISVAQWSEKAGCRGILVYTDNEQYDPWTVAQLIIENTETLCPLIAVQPMYMHPYTVAKKISSIAGIYNRRVYLNMVAGGFHNDLLALGDPTEHDKRYERLTEYTLVIKSLLAGEGPVNYQGSYYQTRGLKLSPRLPPELMPGIFMSGSSEASKIAVRHIGATAIEYPQPPGLTPNSDKPIRRNDIGIRIGIIAREDDNVAWENAFKRFPEDRKGQILHEMAMSVSDSVWHKQLSDMARERQLDGASYWLGPFKNYKTMCPYLVGSYSKVASALSAYIDMGYQTFIIDVPESAKELEHIALAFDNTKVNA